MELTLTRTRSNTLPLVFEITDGFVNLPKGIILQILMLINPEKARCVTKDIPKTVKNIIYLNTKLYKCIQIRKQIIEIIKPTRLLNLEQEHESEIEYHNLIENNSVTDDIETTLWHQNSLIRDKMSKELFELIDIHRTFLTTNCNEVSKLMGMTSLFLSSHKKYKLNNKKLMIRLKINDLSECDDEELKERMNKMGGEIRFDILFLYDTFVKGNNKYMKSSIKWDLHMSEITYYK